LRKIIVGPQADVIVREFMCQTLQNPNGFVGGRGLGMIKLVNENDAAVLAGVWYENYNGANMMMHVASDGTKNWMTREYLWYAFFYPFAECGCKRVTSLIAASNVESCAFVERIGFELEATLKEAAADGDMFVYRMFRQDCKWLRIRERGTIYRRIH
jgi:L-amino acid N-acyltransferase YncA